MPQAFELDFPNFQLLAETKFGNATTPQAFEMNFPNFSGHCQKSNLPMPQRHKESRAIKGLQEWASK
jgi:hypothetical protein